MEIETKFTLLDGGLIKKRVPCIIFLIGSEIRLERQYISNSNRIPEQNFIGQEMLVLNRSLIG